MCLCLWVNGENVPMSRGNISFWSRGESNVFIFLDTIYYVSFSSIRLEILCCNGHQKMPTKLPLSFHLSPGFQRFAVRTSRRMEDLSKMAEQKKREVADLIKDVSKNSESFKNQ